MNYPTILEKAYRQMFPNWDKMSDEEKKAIGSSSAIQGKINGIANAMLMRGVGERASAERAERNSMKNRYSGPL